MKKIYSLLLMGIASASFGQTFYSENFGTPTGTTALDVYATQNAPATFQNAAPITYTGNGDVRATAVSSGYTGASGGGNVFLASTAGENLVISGLNTSAYTTANLQLSFGHLLTPNNTQLVVEVSTDGTNWTPITFTPTTGTGWNLVTIGGGQIPSSTSLSIRFTQNATAQMRIDDVKLSNVSASCTFAFGGPATSCDASTLNLDTYTTNIPFTGGGNATYTITSTAGTVSGANPTSQATGDIIITGVPEGTNFVVTVTGGTCNLQVDVTAPQCKPINPLPYAERFDYNAGTNLGSTQRWTNQNSGDEVVIGAGSLSYTGITSVGNSATFAGAGVDPRTLFTDTTAGTLYASFLMNVTDYSAVTTDGAFTYFAVLTNAAGDFMGRVFIKKTGGQYQLGLTSGTTTDNYTTATYDPTVTLYVVLGYDFTANSLKMWVNPNVATFTAATPATLTDTPATAITSLGGFLLRQDSNTLTPAMTIDELRVATTTGGLLKTAQNNIEGLAIYPNPVSNGVMYIETQNNDVKEVAIFDILGKQVLNTTVTETAVNVSTLKTGVYIVKITEAGKTATRKLVIK